MYNTLVPMWKVPSEIISGLCTTPVLSFRSRLGNTFTCEELHGGTHRQISQLNKKDEDGDSNGSGSITG